jgi:hypothetical protein
MQMDGAGCVADDSVIATHRRHNMNNQQLIAEIEAEVAAGFHDTPQGLRPVEVFVDRDGDIAVAYPAGPDWISWETKVSPGNE